MMVGSSRIHVVRECLRIIKEYNLGPQQLEMVISDLSKELLKMKVENQ